MTSVLIASGLLTGGAAFSFTLFFRRGKNLSDKRRSVAAKILSLAFAACFALRLAMTDVFYDTEALVGIFSKGLNFALVVLRAFTQMCVLALILAPWFKFRSVKSIVAYAVPVVYFIDMALFRQNVYAFLGAVSLPTFGFREVQFAVECVLAFSMGMIELANRIRDRDFDFSKKNILQTLALGTFYLIFAAHGSTLFNLFGGRLGSAKDFSPAHIAMLALTVALLIAGFALLRKCSKEFNYFILTSAAVACFMHFWYYYSFPLGFTNLPLHLCHAAVTLMCISFIFKNRAIFAFNYLVNVTGAIFALILPDSDAQLTSELGVHYFNGHILLVVIPILAVALGVFPRSKIKDVGYCIAVFTGYFLVAGILNAWLVNYDPSVNYFFMNGDNLVKYVAFAARWKNNFIWTFNIGELTFKIYYVYWIAMYVGFIILIFLLWWIYEGMYKVADHHYMLHCILAERSQRKKQLKELLNGRPVTEPLNPEGTNMISIKHFSKIYSGSSVKSVDDLSLEIKGGEVYGFLGHNGAGKSTTIKSLVGIQTITSGTIEVCGYDISKQPLEAKLNIGYVSDNHAVYEQLTGREYINYVADLYLVSKEDREKRIDKYVRMFNLVDAIDKEIKGYSHGMKQKIVVIASLIHNPKVWVLDEPLTGLDPASSYQIKECMREHANNGNIVFFSSHVIEVVEKICDKICIIAKGRLVGEWKISELEKQGLNLEELYMKYVYLAASTATDTETVAAGGASDASDAGKAD